MTILSAQKWNRFIGTGMLMAALVDFQSAQAGTISKNNTAGNLNTTGVWVGGVVPGSSDIAQWDSNDSSQSSASLGGSMTLLGISISNNVGAASYTINSTAGTTLTLGTSGVDMSIANKNFTINSALRLGGTQTWNVGTSRTLTVGGSVSNGANTLIIAGAGTVTVSGIIGNGTGGLTKGGTGILTLSGVNTYTGPTTVNSGTLSLTTAGKFSSSSPLVLGGGNLVLAINGDTTQTFNGTTVKSGFTSVTSSGGNGSHMYVAALGSLVRSNAAGTVDFSPSGSGGQSTTSTNVSSILGAFATFGESDWASVSGGQLTAPSYTTLPSSGSSATVNYSLTGSASLTANESVNTLKLNTSSNGQSLNFGTRTITLSGNGLLFVGANNYTISNGIWTAGNSLGAYEMIVHHYGAGILTNNAAIQNNGANAVALTFSGIGRLVLNATNTYSGGTVVNSGTLEARAASSLDSGNVQVHSGATLALSTNSSMATTASLLLDGDSPSVNLNYSGTQTQTIGALSFDGGLTFQSLGTWGSPTSTAANKDSRFTGSGILLVAKPTTTIVASSANPSVFGQSVIFTATVTGSGGTPTGTVTFKDGVTTLGTGTLDGSGQATLTNSALSVGSHSITAVYPGDSSFATSTSTALSQTVNQSATTTIVASSVNPSVFGQSVPFTATVSASGGGAGTPTGTVTFKDGVTTLGTRTLNGSGQATLTNSALSVGSHSITAVYAGDGNFITSTGTLSGGQTVNQADTSTTVNSSANPICFGQSVTFTGTVTATPPGAGTPSGTVTFMDGVTTLGTGTLNGSGQATFATAGLSAGPHSITAVYAGNSSFATSTSSAFSQTINPIPVAPTAGSNGPICSGSTLNLTASTISGATYSWTGPNGFSSSAQNPSIANATTANSGTYSVTVTVDGCTSAAATTIATVNAIPAAPTAGNNGPICDGQTLNLTASTVSGATYSWTGPNGFSSSAQNPSISNATTADSGTYSVTVTVNGCTSAAATTIATVNAIPAAPTAGNNGPICAGSTLNLTASTVSGATYSWTGPNGFSSSAQNPSIPNATTAAAGTYSVTVTVNGCTSAAATTDATVNPIPSAPTAGNNGPICTGQTLNLTASTVADATYSWTGPNGFSSSAQNPSIPNATSANTGTYSVTVTVNGCTSAAATTAVTINTVPEITCPSDIVVPNAPGQCSSNVTFATVVTGIPTPTVEYVVGGTPITLPYSFPLGETTVNCTASNDCGTATCSFTVTVNDTEPPLITCPAEVTTNAEAGLCSASGIVLGSPITSDNCSGTVTVVNNAPTSYPAGTNEVVWTATDEHANSSTCTQRVIVVETDPPTITTCPAPLTVSCASLVPAVDLESVTATDNCSAVTVSFVSDVISDQSCPNRYTLTRTYQATDAAGNSATCTQTITVDDETAPVISASPADTTVSCTAAVPAVDDNAVTATDNCGAVTVTHDDDVVSNQTCAHRYTISRTYHATDACGNTSSVTQTIIVDDETAPLISASPADATVSCAAAVPAADDNAVTATDNCGGMVTITHDDDVVSDQSCPNRYTLSRTYQATDVCGNSSSITQTIIVDDQTAPVLSGQGADATIETPASPVFTAPTASDNCGGTVTINSSDLTNQLCGTTYSVTRTWTATDACGNAATPVSQTITVNDTTAPLITCPAEVTTNADAGLCAASGVVLGTPITSDNGSGTVTVVNDAPTSFPTGTNLVVWTATDGCANSTSCTQLVIVLDTELPTLTCPAPLTVSCASLVPAVDLESVTATDNCSAVTVSFVSDVISDQSCPNRYTLTRTYQATDAAGNSATCTQTITVDDETAPVISASPADTTVSCTAAVPAVDDNAVTATDNCGAVTVTHDDDVVSNQTCAHRYTISRTYHATDACGNTSSVTQTIIVDDETAPLISASPADATVSCAAAVPAADDNAVTATDNCGGMVTITHDDDVVSDQSCPNRYTLSRTYQATDVCGNSSSITQTIIVDDQTAPVLSGQGADATIETPASPVFTAPTASDNCGGTVTINSSDLTNQLCGTTYSVTRTWTATDACGNAATPVSQTITVNDTTAPLITCPAEVTTNADAGLCAASGVVLGTPITSDNGSGTVTVVNDAPTSFPTGTNLVVWTATDGCANSTSCTQLVIVLDTELPTLTCPAPLTVSCASLVPAVDLESVTATDNCSAVTVSFVSDVISDQSCPNRYTLTRTYQATDAAGNSATCTQTITVDDETAPVISASPADTTVSCTAAVPAVDDNAVTATDNCGAVTVTHDDDVVSNQTCAHRYTISRTYHATDACGNTSSVTQTIIVDDETAPLISASPADATVSCAAAVPAADDNAVTATDNCGGMVTITHDDDVVSDQSCPNRYTLSRTYQATDVCGNSSSITQTIIVDDQTAPVLSGQGADATIETPASPVFTAPTASDNCGGTVTINSSDLTNQLCGTTYSVTRTWTATDACGNAATPVSQTITVNDTTAPLITCPAEVTTNADAGLCAASGVVLGTPITSDNGSGTVTVVNDAPTSFPTGTNLVVWTATDGCANSTSCTQLVIVLDTELPTLTCPAPLTVSCASLVPAVDLESVTATDNCSAVTVSFVSDVISDQSCPNRYTLTRTYQATDAAGNSATCTQTITVDDETAPVISASPADTTVSCTAAVPAVDDNAVTATDNCGAVTVTHDDDVVSNQTCAHRYTISRTYHATDACGNTSSVTQTIIVDDETAPLISASPADATVSCAAAVPAADDNAVTATDNCGGMVTITHDDDVVSDQSCPNRYTLSRTYQATDVCGNSSSITQTIIVDDQTAPVLSGQGADATIETPASPVFTAPTASDNCGGTVTINASDLTNQLCGTTYSVTRTWTATDACGNAATPVSQTITVNDTTAPLITCPAEVTTNADAGLCAASGVVLGTPITSDNGSGTVTVVNDAPTSFPTGTNLVVWTATDGCANSTSCTQLVIVLDTELPTLTCPAPLTVSCASLVPAVDLESVTATDNCSAVTVSFVSDVISDQSCPNRYTLTRTYQATDAAGNSATCTQTITVDDETAPVISASPADTTVSCTAAVPAVDDNAVTATDNCGAVTVTHDDDVVSNQTCAHRYTISRTYHATDACGNTSSVTQTIIVDDETAPLISASPADATVSCAAAVPAADDNAVTATDNCGGMVTITHDDDVVSDQSCPNRYTLSRTYQATDVCGNSSSITQTIIVDDQTAPVLSGQGADATIETPASPVFTAPTASDNCGGTVTINSSDLTNQLCGTTYSVTRTWTATDACGNAATPVSQTITVNDTTAPLITCPAEVTTNADAGLCAASGVVLGTPITSDNGSGTVTVVNDAPTSFPTGTNLVVWTATDGCANSTSCTQLVIVLDTELPTLTCPAPLTVSCASLVPAVDLESVTATDNCSAVTVSFVSDVISDQSCPNRYTLTRTYQATDAAGNSATCTQTITVDDETAPVISASPADTTVSCTAAVPAVDDNAVTATDNCGAVTVTHDDDVVSNQTCAHRYTISRTYHATDACGNTSSVTQTIIVDDSTGPILSGVPADTIVACDAVPLPASPTATDNCDPAPIIDYNEVRTDGSCSNNYMLARTWTATDSCGNFNSQTQMITVENCLPPASFRIVAIAREGNNLRITWTGAAGTTNMLQATSSLTGSFSTDFTDVGQPIILDGCGEVTTNYVDVGVMNSTPARYYRVRLVP